MGSMHIHRVDKGIALGLREVKLLQSIDKIDVQSGGLKKVDQVVIERGRVGFSWWGFGFNFRQIDKEDSLYC